jgi:hypothetical protein
MSRFHAARVAATLRKELAMDVEMVHGRWGDFAVLVDDESVIRVGALSTVAILPSTAKILESVRARLSGKTRA